MEKGRENAAGLTAFWIAGDLASSQLALRLRAGPLLFLRLLLSILGSFFCHRSVLGTDGLFENVSWRRVAKICSLETPLELCSLKEDRRTPAFRRIGQHSRSRDSPRRRAAAPPLPLSLLAAISTATSFSNGESTR